jgi:hypothetical protein
VGSLDNGIALNWLIAGLGDMTYNEEVQSKALMNSNITKLVELFKKLNPTQQLETLLFIEDKNRLNNLESGIQSVQKSNE